MSKRSPNTQQPNFEFNLLDIFGVVLSLVVGPPVLRIAPLTVECSSVDGSVSENRRSQGGGRVGIIVAKGRVVVIVVLAIVLHNMSYIPKEFWGGDELTRVVQWPAGRIPTGSITAGRALDAVCSSGRIPTGSITAGRALDAVCSSDSGTLSLIAAVLFSVGR